MSNYNNWCLKQEIIKQANRESDYDWSKTENPPLPKFRQVEIRKNAVFWKVLLLSLRP